jgi:hypothetical protein
MFIDCDCGQPCNAKLCNTAGTQQCLQPDAGGVNGGPVECVCKPDFAGAKCDRCAPDRHGAGCSAPQAVRISAAYNQLTVRFNSIRAVQNHDTCY